MNDRLSDVRRSTFRPGRTGPELHYELHGEAGERPPLLLVNGMGLASWSFWLQTPALSRSRQVIVLDNRGAGRSEAPDEPYSIPGMAEDARSLLDHLGVARAHVFGVSMGGYIALELVLRHPERIGRLVLGCTSMGGPSAVPLSRETGARLWGHAEQRWSEEALRDALTLEFGHHRPEALIETYLAGRRAWRPPLHGWRRQLQAVPAFDVSDRIAQVRAPTLVLAGDDDPIVPTENARLLARAIPHSALRIWQGARHFFFLEHAEEVNEAVEAFLS